MGNDDAERIKEQQRARIDGSPDDPQRDGDEGVSLSVPSYADSGGVSDLGVDEPVVPRDVQGEHVDDAPEPPAGTAMPRRESGR